jgi:hypothetical protein
MAMKMKCVYKILKSICYFIAIPTLDECSRALLEMLTVALIVISQNNMEPEGSFLCS